MRALFILFTATILLSSCFASKKTGVKTDDLAILKSYMTGSFNSSAQAAVDTNYYNITMHMYPIWEDRKSQWLYVEQAMTAVPSKPYRQRVYELVQVDDWTIHSRVYTLNEPKKYIQAWKDLTVFDKLTRTDIELKDGCEVVLYRQKNGSFKGRTSDKTCSNNLRGARYVTSEVTVSENMVISWDQGWNKKREQVWGATEGGYEFVKQ